MLIPVSPCVGRSLRVQTLVGRARRHAPDQNHRLPPALSQRLVQVPRDTVDVVQREVHGRAPKLEGEMWAAPIGVLDVVCVAERFRREIVAISDQLRLGQKARARQAPETSNAVDERAVEGTHRPSGGCSRSC